MNLVKISNQFVFSTFFFAASLSGLAQDRLIHQAIEVAQRSLSLPRDQVVVKPLSGGLTNHIYLIEDLKKSSSYVLRLAGAEAIALGVDPGLQADIAKKAGELGVGPRVVYLSNDKREMLVEYVKGSPLAPQNYSASVRDDLTKKLRKLHQEANFKNTFDPYQSANEFKKVTLKKPNNTFKSLPIADLHKASAIFENIKAALAQHSPHFIGSAHNDFHCGNILLGLDNKVYLIDWDYAGKSDVFFDLATLANSLDFDRKKSDELLRSYFSLAVSNPRHEAHLGLMRMVSTYWNAMWYFSQVGSSEIVHDYEKSGKNALAAFISQSQSKDYTSWLVTLSATHK